MGGNIVREQIFISLASEKNLYYAKIKYNIGHQSLE